MLYGNILVLKIPGYKSNMCNIKLPMLVVCNRTIKYRLLLFQKGNIHIFKLQKLLVNIIRSLEIHLFYSIYQYFRMISTTLFYHIIYR